ncbi:hypothetical protein Mal15_44040 [Stieleria maiorica]|uniref:Uncharacterized protein n=1 Tax=Stieleria maiorica TaxID=2795974 RepID=A0A5B9MHF5_9BACT|nr:hypothetical protein Mal15_44040 [Stieleria maiorica]
MRVDGPAENDEKVVLAIANRHHAPAGGEGNGRLG